MITLSVGKQTSYDALVEKDANTLYFITDTQKIYKGSQLIANVFDEDNIMNQINAIIQTLDNLNLTVLEI